MVLSYANKMFSAYEELKSRLTTVRNLKNNSFQIGICQNLGTQFSFDLLSLILKSDISQSHKANITFDSSDRLLAGFGKDQFDLVLGAFPPESASEDTCVSQAFSFPVRLFAPLRLTEEIQRPDQQYTQIDLCQIFEIAKSKEIALVLPMRPSVLRDETDRFLAHSKVGPAKTIECNSSSAILQLIDRDFAMGFVPVPCLLDFKSARHLAVLGPAEGYWNHGISVLIRNGKDRSTTKVSAKNELFSDDQLN
jgi:DNA-binding transcriptional LysR family regulator